MTHTNKAYIFALISVGAALAALFGLGMAMTATKNNACKSDPSLDKHSLILIDSYDASRVKVLEDTETHTRYIVSRDGGVCPIYNPDGSIHEF